MKQYIHATLLAASLLSIQGCNSPIPIYKIDVKQGNHFIQEMVNKLKKGQSKEQVKNVLGSPAHIPTLNQDIWIYNYYLIPGTKGKEAENKKLIIHFEQNKVKYWKYEDLLNKKNIEEIE